RRGRRPGRNLPLPVGGRQQDGEVLAWVKLMPPKPGNRGPKPREGWACIFSIGRVALVAPLLQQLRIRSGSATMAVVGMPGVDFKGASPNAHLLVGELPGAQQIEGSWWKGTGLSLAVHALVLGILVYGAMHAQQVVQAVKE